MVEIIAIEENCMENRKTGVGSQLAKGESRPNTYPSVHNFDKSKSGTDGTIKMKVDKLFSCRVFHDYIIWNQN